MLVGASIGFTSAIMNPFSVGVAQGIAELPTFSGMGFRVAVFAVMYLVSVAYIYRYAMNVKRDHTRGFFGQYQTNTDRLLRFDIRLTASHKWILCCFLLNFLVLAVGVIKYGWYNTEIAGLFILLGIVIGVIGKLSPNAIDEIIAGQGTVGLEALLEEPDFDTIVVPAGGGGLICGIAIAAKAINPDVRVIGVQTHASPPWYYSFREKRLVDVEYRDSLADGLHGGISQETLDLALQVVDDFVLVEEAQVAEAMAWLAGEHHYMVEGSGAVGAAALLNLAIPDIRGQKVLSIVTGSNVEAATLAEIINHADPCRFRAPAHPHKGNAGEMERLN